MTRDRCSAIFNHMVKYTSGTIDSTLSALADPTRRAIVEKLATGEKSVLELAKPFDISLPAVSKHLKVLERAGLISRDIRGRVHSIKLVAEPMRGAVDWLERYRIFWDQQLNSLSEYLNKSNK